MVPKSSASLRQDYIAHKNSVEKYVENNATLSVKIENILHIY